MWMRFQIQDICKWKQPVVGDDSTCNCGRFEKASSRIWKGQDTIGITRYPFQIFLIINWQSWDKGDLFCGGALISWKHVVTAAHCIEYTKNNTRDNVYGVAFAGLDRYEHYGNVLSGEGNVGNSQHVYFEAKDVKVHPGNIKI